MGVSSTNVRSGSTPGDDGSDLWVKEGWAPPGGGPTSSRAPSSVLVVGACDPLVAPLTEALVRHGVTVTIAPVAEVTRAVIDRAPELVVLADEATQDGGVEVVARLATSPRTSVVPVAVLVEDTGLEARLQAFRNGVAAVVRRSASVDAIATQIAGLVRGVPGRSEQALGDIGEVTLDELGATLARELRSGILSVRAKGGDAQSSVRIVLGGGRPVSAIIDEFVERMGSHVVAAEPLEYEFDQRAGGTVALFDRASETPPSAALDLAGLRVLLADDDAGRVDSIAQELRAHHAMVAVTDLVPSPQRLARVRELDPAVLLLGEEHLQGAGYGLVQALRGDLRLRWASLLVVRWRDLWPEAVAVPVLSGLLAQLASMGETERSIQRSCLDACPFETYLEATGPARLLRVLADTGCSLRATVRNPRALVRVDLSDRIIVGATAETGGEGAPVLQGAQALAALMVLAMGRVYVEQVAQPAVTNLMAPPDVAFGMAAAERAPIVPSVPAPPPGMTPPAAVQSGSALPRWVLVGAGAITVAGVIGAGMTIALTARFDRAEPTPQTSRSVLPSASARPVVSASASRTSSSDGAGPPPAARPAVIARVEGEVSVTEAAKVNADERCRRAVAEVRGGVGVEVRNAQRAIVRGDLTESERWYCVAVERYPTDSDAQIGLVRLELLRRDPSAALLFAERAVARIPGDLSVLGPLGDAQALAGAADEARATLVRAAGLTPDNAAAIESLVRRYLYVAYGAIEGKRYVEAERYSRRVAVLRPAAADGPIGLARSLGLQGQHELALRWAERAVALGSRRSDAHVALGEARLRARDREGAIQAYRRALELDPKDADARFRLSRLEP
ncbi:MAG: tetratricopeptide repeat protein [Polyangiaceae bacterium]|nr:tetratricopeptide repeat protein [Polyangiaceae bacterium]